MGSPMLTRPQRTTRRSPATASTRLLTRSATVDWDIVRYPDAGHWFNCDQRPSYHEASAKDAWTRALSFLDTHLP